MMEPVYRITYSDGHTEAESRPWTAMLAVLAYRCQFLGTPRPARVERVA